MLTALHLKRLRESFGLAQGLALGAWIIGDLLLALLIFKLPLLDLLGGVIPNSVHQYIGIGLWALEIIFYWSIASSLSKQHIPSTAGGVVLAFLMRFIGLGIIAIFVHTGQVAPQHLYLANAFKHLCVMLLGITMLLGPFRLIIESRFGVQANKASKSKSVSKNRNQPESKYSFNSQKARPRKEPLQIQRAPQAPAAPTLAPPSSFVPQEPAKVNGTVNIPRDVVLKSVPEAKEYLESGAQVRVRMAYLIPQLNKSTAWITWDQLISAYGSEDAQRTALVPSETKLHGRWVRIPGKYFALQIPREYFDRAPVPRPWMKLPQVPQEAQFDDK